MLRFNITTKLNIFTFGIVSLRIPHTSIFFRIFPAVGAVNFFADGAAGGSFRAGKGAGGALDRSIRRELIPCVQVKAKSPFRRSASGDLSSGRAVSQCARRSTFWDSSSQRRNRGQLQEEAEAFLSLPESYPPAALQSSSLSAAAPSAAFPCGPSIGAPFGVRSPVFLANLHLVIFSPGFSGSGNPGSS